MRIVSSTPFQASPAPAGPAETSPGTPSISAQIGVTTIAIGLLAASAGVVKTEVDNKSGGTAAAGVCGALSGLSVVGVGIGILISSPLLGLICGLLAVVLLVAALTAGSGAKGRRLSGLASAAPTPSSPPARATATSGSNTASPLHAGLARPKLVGVEV